MKTNFHFHGIITVNFQTT